MAATFLRSFWSFLCAKSAGFWGGAPDPDGGAYSAPPYPLAGREGCPPPAPSPGHHHIAPPLLLSPSDATVLRLTLKMADNTNKDCTTSIICHKSYRLRTLTAKFSIYAPPMQLSHHGSQNRNRILNKRSAVPRMSLGLRRSKNPSVRSLLLQGVRCWHRS